MKNVMNELVNCDITEKANSYKPKNALKQARCFKSQPQIENSGVPTSRGKIVAVVIGIIGTAHHGNKLSVVRINSCMSKSHRLTHHPVALPLDLDRIQQEVAICMAMKGE